MIGKITVIQDDQKAVFVELIEPANFKMNDLVDIKKHKSKRSISQNRLYWAYLTWIISIDGGGLIEQGHFSPDALHEDIKAWVVSKYPHQFTTKKINKFTTTELDTKEFTEFINLIDRELMVSFFEIDTSKFWGDGEEKALPF